MSPSIWTMLVAGGETAALSLPTSLQNWLSSSLVLLIEEFLLSSHCVWSLCTPPHASLYACLNSGDAVTSSHPPEVQLLREGLQLPVFHTGLGPQDVAGGEVVWAAGSLLPCCLDYTVPVRFQLFPLGSWWHHVYFQWCRKTACKTQPCSFIHMDRLYLENNLWNICVQRCIYSCYRHQLWSSSNLCLCRESLIYFLACCNCTCGCGSLLVLPIEPGQALAQPLLLFLDFFEV